MKPDRFVGVTSPAERHILTRAFWTETPEFYINADMTSGGQLWAEVQDLEGRPIKGSELEHAIPAVDDSIHHRLAWRGSPDPSALADRLVGLRVCSRRATVCALMVGSGSELTVYWRFCIPSHLDMEHEEGQM
jgi:hypothetical protein